jgi:hypothetical protein
VRLSSGGLHKLTPRAKMLLYLVVLRGISQQDVVQAVLERLQNEFDDSEQQKDIFIELNGHKLAVQLLALSWNDATLMLVTNILIKISCTAVIEAILDTNTFPAAVNLLSNPSGRIVENASVILQKCSKHPQMRQQKHLFEAMLEMDFGSEFVHANMRSIKQNTS